MPPLRSITVASVLLGLAIPVALAAPPIASRAPVLVSFATLAQGYGWQGSGGQGTDSQVGREGTGWWEQARERGGEEPRDRYWRLRGRDMERYNRLQVEIDQLRQQRQQIDQRLRADIEEQRRLLGYR